MTVHVCPIKDSECGHRPDNWCDDCPLRAAAPQAQPAGYFDSPLDGQRIPLGLVAPQAQPSESAWLVEHRLAEKGLPFGPAWSCVEHGSLTASTDPSKALRFARREDAEAFATTERDPMFPGTVVATEHEWPQAQPAPVEQRTEDERAAVEFYTRNPSAALLDFGRRIDGTWLARSPEPAPAALDITLNDEETTFLRAFMGEDEGEAPSAIRLQVGSGHGGYGLYVSLVDLPEEGSPLLRSITEPAPVSEHRIMELNRQFLRPGGDPDR